ncbi:plasmid pRiA4b ORF-3 family protein [Salinispirillum marinum]|uniref:Plasmid pRiA4b ORF-3 family protein n=2 Tax=Saccharospirillaceae TaxID=255527 RepID=A0ABV8BIU0_9GAMM
MNLGTAYHLKVTLKHTEPLVWRLIAVDSQTTLERLHHILQISLGWTNSHLHLFESSQERRFGCLAHDEDNMLALEDERAFTVGQLLYVEKQTLKYEYDFGDGWVHEVRLERILPDADLSVLPRCLEAHAQCPPEDVGGLDGFEEFKEAMADPEHEEHEDVMLWNGGHFDPLDVSLEEINDDLANIEDIIAECDRDDDFPDFGMPDFQGFNPQQMHALLYSTFDCPEVVQWADSAAEAENSPVVRLLSVLFESLNEKEVTLTKKGNLPGAMVKAMLAAVVDCNLDIYHWRPNQSVRGEDDASAVHFTRIVAEVSGLLRVAKGKLNITAKARKLLKSKGWGGVHALMLEAFFQQFNWAYISGGSPMMGLRTTAPFTFWLLHRHGEQWLSDGHYARMHLSAFPQLMQESEVDYCSPEDDVINVYCHRVGLVLQLLGLIDVQEVRQPGAPAYPISLHWRASPLFGRVLQWQVY